MEKTVARCVACKQSCQVLDIVLSAHTPATPHYCSDLPSDASCEYPRHSADGNSANGKAVLKPNAHVQVAWVEAGLHRWQLGYPTPPIIAITLHIPCHSAVQNSLRETSLPRPFRTRDFRQRQRPHGTSRCARPRCATTGHIVQMVIPWHARRACVRGALAGRLPVPGMRSVEAETAAALLPLTPLLLLEVLFALTLTRHAIRAKEHREQQGHSDAHLFATSDEEGRLPLELKTADCCNEHVLRRD